MSSVIGVIREVGYFVEDLGATAIVSLGLVVGLVLGGFATYRLTDGTPYSQTDLDRATAVQPADVPTPVAADVDTDAEDAELKAQRLEIRLREVRDQLDTAEQRTKKLRTRLTEATTSRDRLKNQRRQAAATTEVTVTGALEVEAVLGPEQRPWPAGCGDVLGGYQVHVDDGSDVAAAIVDLTDATETGRTMDGKQDEATLTLSCRGTYEVTLTGTTDAVYGFSAVSRDATQSALATVLATAAEVESGEGPTLALSR